MLPEEKAREKIDKQLKMQAGMSYREMNTFRRAHQQ